MGLDTFLKGDDIFPLVVRCGEARLGSRRVDPQGAIFGGQCAGASEFGAEELGKFLPLSAVGCDDNRFARLCGEVSHDGCKAMIRVGILALT